MPRNQEVYINGKIRFAFVHRLNPYGKWAIGIYPDADGLEKVKALIKEGIKNELKRDDDGDWIAFSRPPDKQDRQGRKFTLTPPTVVDKDGRLLTDAIGSGSDVSLKLEVYGGKSPVGSQYKAARLGGVKVFNLIPYLPEESADPREAKSGQGLATQQAPTDAW